MRWHVPEALLVAIGDATRGRGAGEGARASIERSRQRLAVDRIDLIQLHNLVDKAEWRTALGPGGALEALVEARNAGTVRFLGVTGHGTTVASRHRQSLERFTFDSVLLPYNFPMLAQPGLFLNTTSDATVLPAILAAAAQPVVAPTEAELRADAERHAMEPLFTVGGSDAIDAAGF